MQYESQDALSGNVTNAVTTRAKTERKMLSTIQKKGSTIDRRTKQVSTNLQIVDWIQNPYKVGNWQAFLKPYGSLRVLFSLGTFFSSRIC